MKKVVIVKAFSGLADALIGSSQGEWEVEVVEDYKDPENMKYSIEEAFELAEADGREADLLIVEDMTFYRPLEKRMGGRDNLQNCINPSMENSKLEWDRNYGKEVCDSYGIPYIPSRTFNITDKEGFKQMQALYKGKRIVAKFRYGHMITLGDAEVVFANLEMYRDKGLADRENTNVGTPGYVGDPFAKELMDLYGPNLHREICIEECVDMEDAVEFSLCFLCNGIDAIPVCTLFDLENRLLPGNMGPKISDVSQIIYAGVNEKKWENIIASVSEFVSDKGYVGWLDVDLMYDFKKKKAVCFEFMARFAIPSFSSIVKLYDVCWFDVFHAAVNHETIDPEIFKKNAVGKWSVSVGIFGMSTEFNNMSGPVATGEEVQGDWRLYHRWNSDDSNRHLVPIECFYDEPEDRLFLAGDWGRFMSAIGTSPKSWHHALTNAYDVCESVKFTNKVYKRNLFGYNDPSTSDSDLSELGPKLLSHGIID